MSTRRTVLSLLAAAPLAPVLLGCAPADLPDPYAAWRDPGAGQTDPRRFALAHAILAPNPHNTQPWLVELDDADGMILYCDLDRRLPFTDPLDRQITMGCGAFLQLYCLAAMSLHYGPEIEFFPEGEPSPRLDGRPLARVRLGQSAPRFNADPIFASIAARRTNRAVYDVTQIPTEDALSPLGDVIYNTGEEYPGGVHWTIEPARVAQLRDLTWRAFDLEMHTAGALEETFGWLRFGREEIARRRDGLAIEGPMIPVFKALGFLSHDSMVDPNSTSNKQALRDWQAKAESAPAFAWLTSSDDTPTTRLIAGMAYARINLAATSAGLAMHPWSQALQEYPEMADLYTETREALGIGSETLQMLVRVGYAEAVSPSARRDVEAFMRT